jgi:hypothetical protein
MSERSKATGRVLIVITSALAAIFAAQVVQWLTLAVFIGPDPRGGYTIDYLRGGGFYLAIANFAALAAFAVLTGLIVKVVYRRRPVDRALVIVGGYAGASAAAGLTMSLVYLVGFGVDPLAGAQGPGGLVARAVEQLGMLYMFTLVASAFVVVFALLPALAVILYAERKRLRSAMFYAPSGAAIGIAAAGLYMLLMTLAATQAATWPTASELVHGILLWLALFGLPGLVGGLAYWGIAGRRAGQWHAPATEATAEAS